MRPLSSDLREFIHLLNTKSVKYVIVGAWALAFHGRPGLPREPGSPKLNRFNDFQRRGTAGESLVRGYQFDVESRREG